MTISRWRKSLIILHWCILGFTAPGKPPPIVQTAKEVALETWVESHHAALRKHSDATYEVLEVIDNPWSCRSDFIGGFRLEERTKVGKVCSQGFRDLAIVERSGKIEIGNDFLWAENCCPGTPCPGRTPMGWMLELRRREGAELLLLYSAKYGFGDNGRKVKRAQLLKDTSHFNLYFAPHKDRMECPPVFDSLGEARCTKSAGGEGYSYYWKKDATGVYYIGFSVDHEE